MDKPAQTAVEGAVVGPAASGQCPTSVRNDSYGTGKVTGEKRQGAHLKSRGEASRGRPRTGVAPRRLAEVPPQEEERARSP